MSARRMRIPGVLIYGRQVWLSELPALALAGVVVIALLALGGGIAVNAAHINGLSKQLVALEHEDMTLRHRLEQLRKQRRLLLALQSFGGRRVRAPMVYRLSEQVFRNSQQFGYDPLLVLAVIRVESWFDPDAIGRYRSGRESGALGLMQLKFSTAQLIAAEIGVSIDSPEQLFDPEINVPLGIAYLTKEIARFRSFKLGLLAYNQGPGTILQNLRERTPLSTDYYNKVLKAYYGLLQAARDSEAAVWE